MNSDEEVQRAFREWHTGQVHSFIDAKLNKMARRYLERLPKPISEEFKSIFSLPPRRGVINFRARALATVEMKLSALDTAVRLIREDGIEPDSVKDLVCPALIKVIDTRIRTGTWAGLNARRVCADVRSVYSPLFGKCPRFFSAAIARYNKMPRRRANDVVLNQQMYIRGALEAEKQALALKRRGCVKLAWVAERDALHLALATIINWRRSENVNATVGDVEVSDKLALVQVHQTKTHDTRLVAIREPELIRMLCRLLDGRKSRPLFTGINGSGLSGSGQYQALARTGRRYLGVHICHNTLRRAAASAAPRLIDKRACLGHSDRSDVAETVYSQGLHLEGIQHARTKLRDLAALLRPHPSSGKRSTFVSDV